MRSEGMTGERRQKTPIIDGIEDFLKKLELTAEDFRGKVGGITGAHRKVTEGILKRWRETDGFGIAKIAYTPRGRTYGIDVIGRDYERGKILMSVEVDTWHRPIGSWMKLLDIRSENKVWIYVTKQPKEKAEENFRESIEEIKALISARKEESHTMGNFVAFLKTPELFKREIINLQEAVGKK
jgi:hypothetical protein